MIGAKALRQAPRSAPGTLAGDREPYAFSDTQPGRNARYSMETTGPPLARAGRCRVILNRSAKYERFQRDEASAQPRSRRWRWRWRRRQTPAQRQPGVRLQWARQRQGPRRSPAHLRKVFAAGARRRLGGGSGAGGELSAARRALFPGATGHAAAAPRVGNHGPRPVRLRLRHRLRGRRPERRRGCRGGS